MSIPQLTSFPDPPRIYQPEEEFDAKADEMAGHLPVLVNEINAMVAGSNAAWADINSKTTAATIAATTASNAATAASTSASSAEAAKQAAEVSAGSAGSSASAALGFKNAAEVSAANAANSASAAATSAVYAKNRIDHVITQSGLTVDVNDATQLQKAMINATKLLGGANYGALANIFMGAIHSVQPYTPKGDFSKISAHASFAGAGYLHLKLHSSAGYSMPHIHLIGYEYQTNNPINETAVGYLYGSAGVYQQTHTNGANATVFYYSTIQSAFMLRIKINAAYFLSMRLDAMDANNVNPFDMLSIMGGVLTPLTVETI